MQALKHSQLQHYAIAVLAVGVVLALKLLLYPLIGSTTPFLFFFGAVMLSAWYGGLAPGLLATVLAALAVEYFFLPPIHSVSIASTIRSLAFILEGTLISVLCAELGDARRQAELSLREAKESQLRFRGLFESSIIGMIIGDFQGHIFEANDTFLNMVGYTREEALSGKVNFLAMTPPQYQHLDEQAMEQMQKTGFHAPFEKEYIRKDGSRIPVLVTTVYLGSGNNHTGIGLLLDISDRKQTQEKLQKSQERLELAQQAAKIGTFEWNVQTNEVIWTPELEALYGLAPGSFGGQYSNWAKTLHPEDRAKAEQEVIDAATVGTALDNEFRVYWSDGSIHWIAAKARVFNDQAGRPLRMIGVNIDITERKQAEEERNQLLNREQIARAAAETAEQRAKFLAEASRVLASSLDYKTTLTSVAGLAVPQVADWCAIDIIDENQSIQRLVVNHQDPTKVDLARELQQRYPPTPSDTAGVFHVLRTGQSEILTEIPDSLLVAVARDSEHLQILRTLGLKSYMIVPLVTRERLLGAITFVTAESDRRYSSADLALAEDLARRAAVAVDNARLYHEAQEALKLQQRVEEKLTLLVEASSTLISSLQLSGLLPEILNLSSSLIAADAYAVWRFLPSVSEWQVVCATGLPTAYQQAVIPATNTTPKLPDIPLAIEDVYQEPLLAERWEGYRQEGIRSILILPLKIQGKNSGTLTFYYRQTHHFTHTEVRVGVALANLSASAISTTELYEEQRHLRSTAEAAQQRLAFLAEISKVLSSSLDYEITLAQLAHLAVPQIADSCLVHLVEESGTIHRLEVAHVNPAKEEALREMQRRYPLNLQPSNPLFQVLNTGQSQLIREIPDALLVAVAQDAEHLHLLRELSFKSAIMVPLVGRNRVLGVLTFTLTESNRHYSVVDLSLAEDIARRAAIAVDNAQLYYEAQQTNRIKDEFLATLSHELRTPLNAMMGWTNLLRTRQFDTATTSRALETIDRNTKSLAQLIEDLLDVSRIITGKLKLNTHPVSLVTTINTAIETVQAASAAKQIQIHTVFDPVPITVSGDELRLQQVVWNLLSNAIKFTPKGGQVEVRLECDRSHAQIIVIDSGMGISADFLPYIFERFRQADGAITRKHGGLGLGLAIVRHLVELHGGSIEAKSQGEGQGATFIVTLPLRATRTEAVEKTLSPNVQNAIAREEALLNQAPPLNGLWVLIVDDEADARELLTTILEASGAEVTAVASTSEAFALVAQSSLSRKPDVLISDISMPDEDGYTLMRKVRELEPERGGQIPAAALTAYARVEERTRALLAGFQIHIAKPVEPNELVTVVASLAGRVGSK